MKMIASKFVSDMLTAGCYFDKSDGKKLVIPADVAERVGVLPGYFYIHDPVDGTAKVEKYLADGTLEQIQ